jgi:uncharacterized protein YjeT (DUF2065 family)
MTHTIWLALALVLILEGLGPLLFPNRWQNYIRQLSAMPSNQLRQVGGVLVIIGAICVFFML